jgi:thioredoxin reductase
LTVIDIYDQKGKFATPNEHYEMIVVGGGSAGLTEAIASAKAGKSVLLVEEAPSPPTHIGTDVPYFFGGRATAAVQNSARMVEAIFASNPAYEAAFEAGVDVRLGTCAWGHYRNGPGMQVLPKPMLGLADAERTWMVSYDALVVATGARDLVLALNGWNAPGVMGAQGFYHLLTRYDAFAGQKVLILGSGALGLGTALLAQASGLEVVGVVEVLDHALAASERLSALSERGIPLYLSHAVSETTTSIDGISGATLNSLSDGSEIYLECDTIVQAFGTIPALELLAASGANPDNTIRLVGDCAADAPNMAYVQDWARALNAHMSDDTIICQCEEVTRGDLHGVQPPHYLARPAPQAARSLTTLVQDGPPHPDQIKRLTRAGMGTCQGRRCREQVACLLSAATNMPLAEVPTASYRAPVRPIPLNLLADWEETEGMAAGWDVWFGIPTQWTPYAIIGTADEDAHVSIVGGYSHV